LLFDQRIFFFIMLPPIIFAAGYNMKRRNFFKYFNAIMLFAIVGTVIAITGQETDGRGGGGNKAERGGGIRAMHEADGRARASWLTAPRCVCLVSCA